MRRENGEGGAMKEYHGFLFTSGIKADLDIAIQER